MLTVCSWLWGDRYKPFYAHRLFLALKRNIKQDFKSVLITNQPISGAADETWPIDAADRDLLYIPGCLARLRMFDAAWQKRHGLIPGDRIVCVDLDVVVTGELDLLFERDDEFTIVQGINTTNPNPMNGSLWMFRAGTRHDVWGDFSVDAASKIPWHAFPDDQSWFWHKMPNAGGWGPADGVYGFKKVGWPSGDELPENARIVAFPGWRDPSKFEHLPWVKEHWC